MRYIHKPSGTIVECELELNSAVFEKEPESEAAPKTKTPTKKTKKAAE